MKAERDARAEELRERARFYREIAERTKSPSERYEALKQAAKDEEFANWYDGKPSCPSCEE